MKYNRLEAVNSVDYWNLIQNTRTGLGEELRIRSSCLSKLQLKPGRIITSYPISTTSYQVTTVCQIG